MAGALCCSVPTYVRFNSVRSADNAARLVSFVVAKAKVSAATMRKVCSCHIWAPVYRLFFVRSREPPATQTTARSGDLSVGRLALH